jgi:hypothetical protein
LSLLPFIAHLRCWCFNLYGRLLFDEKGESDLLPDNGKCRISLKAHGH